MTPKPSTLARSELILGGQKSGKSRRSESLAQTWLAESTVHKAVLIATAQPWDDEMRQRIARHQADRSRRVPGMTTVEEPLHLAQALSAHSRVDTLVVVDCLTLWLTHCLMPFELCTRSADLSPDPENEKIMPNSHVVHVYQAQSAMLLEAIAKASGPVVLVGNEIGLGVIPMGAEVRAFVDALGVLNQAVARVCQRVTLMAAGLPLTLKDAA
jgi:adenosylcobinamide kinase/adenosylcobinamide-phosphate guanylyltransferase